MDSNDTKANEIQQADDDVTARRDFIKRMGKASAAAPAIALLMAANFKSANAQSTYGGGCGSGSS